jgi:cob(I)alamin adenosyltransferase
LVMVLVPSAKSVAAISFNTLFFAPPTATSPDNRAPPVTTNRSLTRASVDSTAVSVSLATR